MLSVFKEYVLLSQNVFVELNKCENMKGEDIFSQS